LSGELVVRVTIWIALAAWGYAEWRRLRGGAGADRSARLAWTMGAVFTALHVLAAFHVRHAWSHASAVADTARQTREALGFAFGGGVYVNYAFLAVWLADAAWWWLAPRAFAARPRALDAAVRAFILFIFVNGAIVFPHGLVRVAGTLVLLAIAFAWYRRKGAEREVVRA
jgi:hypothetical protein